MSLTSGYGERLLDGGLIEGHPMKVRYGKRHSIIQQPPNPTSFSGPIECRIREVSLYK